MNLCCSIAALVALTSIRVLHAQQLNYLTLYVINRKPVDGETHVYNSFVDFSPLNDTEFVEVPTNYAPIRRKTTFVQQNSSKDTRKPVNRNSTKVSSDTNQTPKWPFKSNPTTVKQTEEITNNIHTPNENFKIIALCDKTLAILDYSNGGDYLNDCELFDLEKNPETAFRKAHKLDLPIQQVDFKTMKDTINRCRELTQQIIPIKSIEENKVDLNQTDDSWGLWRGLIPGTKWCGLGDTAKDYYDLGEKRDIDLCCRAHDHCPIRLKAFRYGYGLINFSFYTKSHCECDEDFHRCLKKQPDDFAATLGNFYFNIMKIQCIKEDNSTICLEKKMINGREECLHFRPTLKHMKFSQPNLSF
ncbi:Phospholipase A2 isozyme PA4-like protein [Leptotrombidium deliense]|uniref:Phospholipase A2 n=1 Tax=Leptotrombidium deliense TaxID=299467 RepID=A0A443SI71_9ACAR|nr:Phospholipase A2 isozyme PA4-like protein [Leptotrombidium deliense]